MIYFWKNILKAVPSFLPPIIVGMLLTKLLNINIIIQLIAGIIIYSAVYILSVWLFGMNTYERNLFKAPINKIMKKCGVGNK